MNRGPAISTPTRINAGIAPSIDPDRLRLIPADGDGPIYSITPKNAVALGKNLVRIGKMMLEDAAIRGHVTDEAADRAVAEHRLEKAAGVEQTFYTSDEFDRLLDATDTSPTREYMPGDPMPTGPVPPEPPGVFSADTHTQETPSP